MNAADPIYVAYHDEEWGVPVHDDKYVTYSNLIYKNSSILPHAFCIE